MDLIGNDRNPRRTQPAYRSPSPVNTGDESPLYLSDVDDDGPPTPIPITQPTPPTAAAASKTVVPAASSSKRQDGLNEEGMGISREEWQENNEARNRTASSSKRLADEAIQVTPAAATPPVPSIQVQPPSLDDMLSVMAGSEEIEQDIAATPSKKQKNDSNSTAARTPVNTNPITNPITNPYARVLDTDTFENDANHCDASKLFDIEGTIRSLQRLHRQGLMGSVDLASENPLLDLLTLRMNVVPLKLEDRHLNHNL
ncbi:hypothetical protein FRACYDRAFT_267546 [Fragilariopsis cylindrus CCMP1102]|uniref:Uncharacterized protein n=1 Tax=Fragilariopsis cylindrus CCMP1102 TaxID=635003 RepID=A0A1E7G043_9STRA|nr:hypothetical protein FRACYDRAFT_267546 [Fragilariopsis cylindrus CCMP1102]|eukprot:OEU23463.1 hypothetical protein FRACYDRAFT_267546 [Fragilariopsis cylindrus CCMP1102]